MSEWKEHILEDIIDKFIDYRGKTPEKTTSGIPLITAKIVKSGKLLEANEFISENDYDKWMTRGLPEINDIVLTTEAPLGEIALIKDKRVALAQRIITLRGKNQYVHNPFLKYYFQSSQGQYELQSRASGTTVFGIKAEVLKKVPVILPPLPEQKAIASVLSSLDDKIDLLNRQNKTLEAMAETLFRQWFIEPCKDGLPEGWREGNIDSLVSVKSGTTPSTSNPDYWGGEIYWTSPRDITNLNGIFLFDTERKITELGLKQIGSGLLPSESLLMSSRAPVGVLAFTEIPVAINQGYAGIVCDKGFSREFLYLWLKTNMDYVQSHANGSTFQEISKSSFKSLLVQIADEKYMDKFDSLISPLFLKLKKNSIQIHTLEKLRDTLLPKLISGEVRVKV